MTRSLAPLLALGWLCFAPSIHAQYAEPPAGPVVATGPDAYPGHELRPFTGQPGPTSTVRVATGPALRLGAEPATGGVAAALDVGRRAAGARFTGSWMGVGQQMGLAQYTGELWLDFGYGRLLHPTLGAGGGVARIDFIDDAGDSNPTTLGIGLLRAGLQYGLPIRDTDARAGIDLIGSVPAVRSPTAPRLDPWLLVCGTVAVGF